MGGQTRLTYLTAINMNHTVLPLSEIRPHPRNYRKHPADQIEHLKQSITEHGIYRNIVVTKAGIILAGHGVVEAATALGMTEVPCVVLDIDPESPKAIKLLTADNELGNLAEIDDRLLTELLREVMTMDPEGLLGTGFDEAMLANLVMVTRPASEIKDHNAAAEWLGAGMPEHTTKPPSIALTIFFDTEGEREKFVKAHVGEINTKRGAVWTTFIPNRPRNDRNSVKFQ